MLAGFFKRLFKKRKNLSTKDQLMSQVFITTRNKDRYF